jgi:hypothetical protein
MGKDHTGQPSGTNKSEATGVPAGGQNMDDLQRDGELTDRYTNDDGGIAEGVRSANPNRNVDKEDATNAGGYKQ